MERLIADALDSAEISYVTDEGGANPSHLDFRLHNGIEIEVKRFHSPRVAQQMARAENVIVAQGAEAVEFLAEAIRALRLHRMMNDIHALGCAMRLVEGEYEGEA
jgi:hypothetical protein